MMVDMDYEEYMPPDARIMEECPWTDFVDKNTGMTDARSLNIQPFTVTEPTVTCWHQCEI
jgi:hypothetical protein